MPAIFAHAADKRSRLAGEPVRDPLPVGRRSQRKPGQAHGGAADLRPQRTLIGGGEQSFPKRQGYGSQPDLRGIDYFLSSSQCRGPRRSQPQASVDLDDDDLPADELLDRTLGDADLLLELQLSAYAPAKWDPVANEFARYGYNVITGWIRTGAIFDQVARATGHQLRRPEDRLDDDAIATLTTDTVVAASTPSLATC